MWMRYADKKYRMNIFSILVFFLFSCEYLRLKLIYSFGWFVVNDFHRQTHITQKIISNFKLFNALVMIIIEMNLQEFIFSSRDLKWRKKHINNAWSRIQFTLYPWMLLEDIWCYKMSFSSNFDFILKANSTLCYILRTYHILRKLFSLHICIVI